MQAPPTRRMPAQVPPTRPFTPKGVAPLFKHSGNAGIVPAGSALLISAALRADIDMDHTDRVLAAAAAARQRARRELSSNENKALLDKEFFATHPHRVPVNVTLL